MRRSLLRPTGHIHLPIPITNQSPAPNEATAKLAITATTLTPQYYQYCPMDPPSLPREPGHSCVSS